MTQKLLCALDDLEEGEIKKVNLEDGSSLAVYLVDGEVYATDDKCTHGDASLADTGALDGCVVECGLHLGCFDVRTGAVMSAPCSKPLRIYPVCIRDQKVWAEFSEISCGETC
ncbi:non-heme iron oxygenase ferredoxin subunit [Ferribacterium limneticum]|uniref:non-heme iron oxygenase ferredoxin subunit n=1 Tax=Ferribacterium limneticum TaxID=76259 RepID=UPI001CFB615E|nr:non-heme iron oxygenase ferredoxin subunit [Ferribacterium limneticum]UCV17771.1 non-heme iron oxygenase ferredoxin subunit [Ferribacterium limneticum]